MVAKERCFQEGVVSCVRSAMRLSEFKQRKASSELGNRGY